MDLLGNERVFLGEGLFETLRVIEQKPCYANLHWQRLRQSAFALTLPFECSLSLWYDKLQQCIAINQLQEGGIKVLLVAGQGATRGLGKKSDQASLLVTGFHYPLNQQPLRLSTAAWVRDANNPIYQHKSINYLEAIFASRQAQEMEAGDALFFNLQQQVTETTVANIFLIFDNNQLVTPELQQGVLPGIIRQRLLILCKQYRINCSERPIDRSMLKQADAMFTCNVLQGIRAVAIWEECRFNTEHPLIKHLQQVLAEDQYMHRSRLEC